MMTGESINIVVQQFKLNVGIDYLHTIEDVTNCAGVKDKRDPHRVTGNQEEGTADRHIPKPITTCPVFFERLLTTGQITPSPQFHRPAAIRERKVRRVLTRLGRKEATTIRYGSGTSYERSPPSKKELKAQLSRWRHISKRWHKPSPETTNRIFQKALDGGKGCDLERVQHQEDRGRAPIMTSSPSHGQCEEKKPFTPRNHSGI
ncbi:hypothetical protein Tco_0924726 [Tanacetum coccineum]|uniref:Uncharacterized protein n=1 Tax=Tanacetum coccineum TaxID=301880 RepID=A0ABQ5D7H0_9ASTR